MKRCCLSILLCLSLLNCSFGQSDTNQNNDAQHLIKACYPTWIMGEYPPTQLPFDQLDEIWLSFAYPSADGSLDTSDIKDVDLLSELARQKGKDLVLVVGGATRSEDFHPLSADSARRERFSKELVDYALLHGFSGVNIDWEYWPTPEKVDPVASTNYVKLLANLSTHCKKSNLQLSVCVFASNWYGKHYPAETALYIDELVIMAMDGAGGWSEIAHHSDLDLFRKSWFYWKAKFAPIASVKYSFTVPFYGVAFQNDHKKGDPVRHPSYDELLSSTKQAFLNDTLKLGNEVIIHSSAATLKQKIDFIKMQGLGDLTIWQIGFDRRRGKYSLLNFMNEEFKK